MEDSGTCWVVEGGGGCRSESTVVCPDTGGGSSEEDSGGTLVAEGGGGGSDCSTVPVGGGWGLLLALLVLARRRGPVLLALLLCAPAWAVDAQHLQGADGGRFATLTEPWRSPPWSLRAAVTASYAQRVVVLRSGARSEVLLDSLLTTEVGASVGLGEMARLGVSMPYHGPFTYDGQPSPVLRGDTALWATVHLSPPEQAAQRTWTVAVDVPSAAQSVLLGDGGAVRGTLAGARPLGEQVQLATQLGIRLQQPTELPGVTWGRRVEGGMGADWLPRESLGLTTELFASAPIGEGTSSGRGAWPVELLVGARRRAGSNTWVRVNAGVGLTAGIGAPAWRLGLSVYGDDVGSSDRDEDGIVDLRDRCPDDPEDLDQFRDQDGCPEPDNDLDGILDANDACPLAPEVYNDHEDEDGCPDAVARLRLTLHSADPMLESATLTVNGVALTVIPGEPVELRMPVGWVDLFAEAPGHRAYRHELPLMRDKEADIVLEPLVWGALSLTVTDPGGRHLDARLSSGAPVPRGPLRLPVGEQTLTVVAEGYQPGSVTVTIPSEGTAAATVVLQPGGPWLDDTRLRIADPISFELDSAELTASAKATLRELAAWLQVHPEVRLLRVEGLADAIGTPAYNHGLSVARAQSVAAALVAGGVARSRLEPIGSGEAHAAPGLPRDDDRSVRFLVIVWDADVGERPDGVEASALSPAGSPP